MEWDKWLGVTSALLGVVSSGVLGYLAYAVNRQMARVQVRREIGELYDRVVSFRAEHPEVLKFSRRWRRECFKAVYSQCTEGERGWALYYAYVELCLGFCNAVLGARERGLLEEEVYEGQYKPLVKMVLTENVPFVADVLVTGKYVSRHIRGFWEELEREGWRWEEMHMALANPEMGGAEDAA